jgi:hypothetical protein
MQLFIGGRSYPVHPRFVPWKGISFALLITQTERADEPLPLNQLKHESWKVVDCTPIHELFLTQQANGNLWVSAANGLH